MSPPTVEERLEALEAGLVAVWRVVEALAEKSAAPKLERAHQAIEARLKDSRREVGI